jgi:hypothetical protein
MPIVKGRPEACNAFPLRAVASFTVDIIKFCPYFDRFGALMKFILRHPLGFVHPIP